MDTNVGSAIILTMVALLGGLIVFVWMSAAGIPSFIAAPSGVFSFLVLIAAFFGIGAVVIAAIKAISNLFS